MIVLLQGSNIPFTVAFVVVAVLFRWRKVPWSAWGSVYVSLGILGTFWGILIALLGFNVGDVAGSVPTLIDGMKTAFATSVVGTTVAIFTRLAELLRPRTVDSTAPRPEDYIAAMRKQVAALEAIKAAIGGENDSSLLSQMQKMRLDLQEQGKEIKGQREDMKEFIGKVSDQSTEAIVKALQEVIRDFNTKINDQFGENFKHLNQAIERLVVWMEKHQGLIDTSHTQLLTAIQAIESAGAGLNGAANALGGVTKEIGGIKEQLRVMTETLEALPGAIQKIRDAIADLSGDAGSLSENVEKLGSLLSTLTTANESLTTAVKGWTELAERVPDATGALRDMVAAVKSHADAVTEQQASLISVLQGQVQSLAKQIEADQKKMMGVLQETTQNEIKRVAASVQTEQARLLNTLAEGLQVSGSRNHESIERQIKALEDGIGKELTTALTSLGGNLASLSEKFVKDYTPLTARLQEIVRLAEKVQPEDTRRVGARHE
jgi:chromosome segregation ATPase